MRHILQSLARATALLGLILIVGGHAATQEALPPEVQAAIDRAAADVLRQTGAPSASIAVVRAGSIAYLHAYGAATIAPAVPAATSMRYSIGSISKQFTAAAVLLLVEEGRLSLDDKVARWFPDLTQADEVSVRQLLSMTSGYQDFWPEDYVMPPMLEPVTPRAILDRWARKPLDFNPGTKWQYSNTNYVIAGLIVEQVSGQPLFEFLRQRIFAPLKMSSVVNSDIAPLGPDDPARYLRYALGPARPAPKEGAGWMFGAGELAMTATDLARWDIATIAHSLLQPSSYQQMQTETVLANGAGTRYGLGVSVGMSNGKRVISHSGEVSGFTARNTIYPDDDVAVVVLTNLDATTASSQLATRIEGLVFKQGDAGASPQAEQARSVFESLQHGRLDRSLFTPNANAYFSRQALDDFQSSLRGLGTPREFSEVSRAERGGMAFREYRVAFKQKTLRVTTYTMPDGKLEQYIVATDD